MNEIGEPMLDEPTLKGLEARIKRCRENCEHLGPARVDVGVDLLEELVAAVRDAQRQKKRER